MQGKNHFARFRILQIIEVGKHAYVILNRGSERGGCRARFTGIKIENSRFTGIETDFSRITHNSAFALTFHPCTRSFPPIFYLSLISFDIFALTL